MNYETSFSREQPDAVTADVRPARRSRRRWIILAAVLVLAGALAAWYFGSGSADKAAAAAKKGARQSPTVSVIVPGRQTADRIVSATGTLAARRELPVGVAGEGGMVTRVLVEPGQWVGAGQVLATIDRQVQTQTTASLAAQVGVAQSDARLAQANLDRAQALVARGFISKADIDRLTATRDAARARVRVAQAQVAESRARSGRLDIRAPAAGLVLTRGVEPGQVVSAGSGVLFRLAQGGEIELLAQLSEDDLARMRVGLQASVVPVGTQQSFDGQIWQLSPVIDPQTRQGVARIALGYDAALRPGGFASTRIVSGSAVVPLLPESAVQTDQRGRFVLVVGRDNKVARRDVQVGVVGNDGVTITDGLSGQEQVVVSAGAFLNPGETVIPTRVKAS